MNSKNLSLILTFFVTAVINCFAQLIPLTPLDYHFTGKYTDEVNPGNFWVISPFGNEVRYIQNNTWMAYDNFDFGTGATHAFIEAAPISAGGGTISVRTGSATGPVLGSVVVPGNTNGAHYRTLEIPLPGGISGVKKLYFTFTGGTGYLLTTRAFWFPKAPANTKQVGSIVNATTFDTESHPGAAPVVANAGILESNTDSSWIAYNGFNFGTGTNRVQIEASAAERGGLVELRTGSSNGPLIGTVDINHTGSWTHYRTFTANLTQDISGTSDLYLRFVNSKGGVASAPMFNLKRFSFYRVAPPVVAPSQQRLSVYPPVPGLPQSPYYQLSVQKVSNLNALKQNATNYLQPFAWFTKCVDFPAAAGKGSYFDEFIGSWSHTYCNFELDPATPIVVKITRLNHGGAAPSGPIKTANAHPAHKVLSCEVINGEVYVTMSEPALVAVDIDGQLDSRDAPRALPSTFVAGAFPYRSAATGAHSVSIFANPFIEDKPSPTGPGVFAVEPGTLPPTSGDWTTLYFKPGIHNFSVDASGNDREWIMSDAYPLYNGKNYYIPGDAIVYGNTRGGQDDKTPSTDIRVYGHGTLSGTKMVHPGDLNPPLEKKLHPTTMMLILGKADNCHYEGITVADPPYHGIGMYAEGPRGTAIRWVKNLSWRVNNDALGVGGGVVEDCFFRHQDDGVYVESTSVRRCTFWSDVNGRPLRCSFMSRGAEPNLFSAAETVVEDCDIIYARGVFNTSTTDFGVIGTSDTMADTTTFNDGTKNTGQTVIFRNIRVTDPRPQRHLLGFTTAPAPVPTFAGWAGIRFENIEYRYPQTWGWKNRLIGTATTPSRYSNFKNVSIAGEWMDQPMLENPFQFVTDYVSNMIFSSPTSNNTLKIQPSSGGTIFQNSAANHFAVGTEIQVSATPSPGFIFGSWGGALAGTTANPAILAMNGNKTVSANFIALPTPAAFVQINAGGPAFIAGDGTTYAGDGTYSSSNGFAIGGFQHGPLPAPAIGNTADDTLYQRARAGASFSYNFAMKNGEYEVTLKFADTLSSAANQNVFDVVMEGKKVIYDLDVFDDVGKNVAVDQTFTIKVSDGVLDIDFTADLGNAFISAMRVKNATVANFTLQTSQLNGSVTLTPDAGSYPAGTSVELTATPLPGYTFTDWGGDLSGTLNPQTVVMNGNKNITCNFIYIPPNVTVTATDPAAAEPSNHGTFTFTRGGITTADLTVNFTVGGTASSGSDYVSLGNSVVIPSGQASATKTVTVNDDQAIEGNETAIVTLTSNTNYNIDSPNTATVNIANNDFLAANGWIVSASSFIGSPIYALDTDLSTRWSTGAFQTPGQWFQIDLGTARPVSQLVLDSGIAANDYPRGYQVTLSLDGVTWGSPVATGVGTSALLTIDFTTQTTRYIRVTQTGSATLNWWSIYDFKVNSLPHPWQTLDVGPVGIIGSVGYGNPTWTITGSGQDMLSGTDEFRYVHQASSGDCEIIARVASLANTGSTTGARAGVMIRSNTAPNSPYAYIYFQQNNRVVFQRRLATSSFPGSNGAWVSAGARWLKLNRTGNSFTAFHSSNGTDWDPLGSVMTINMPTAATIGMAVTSVNNAVLITGTIDNVIPTP